MPTGKVLRRLACRWPAAWVWLAAPALLGDRAWGYIEAPYALGRIVAESTNISVLQVERVDRKGNLITYRKVRDLKGTEPAAEIKHLIGRGGFNPREWQTIMAWAEVGKTAVWFRAGNASETCIDRYWYQAFGSEVWTLNHAEPFLLRTFAGPPEKLAEAVAAILAGRESIVPCMVDGDRNALILRTARLQRMRASLTIQDYNVARDFVGWGVEEFRAVAGMPAFTHVAPLRRVDPEAAGVAPADFDLDGKTDVCLFGATRVALLQNGGATLADVPLALAGGARSADWANADGDTRPDLLLATPAGVRLFLNREKGFEDASASLPPAAYSNALAAAWIEADGDTRPDLVVADGFRGLVLYRNRPAEAADPKRLPWPVFEDVSETAGLRTLSAAVTGKVRHLAVADVNGDGRPDLLLFADAPVLALNTGGGFALAREHGLAWPAGGVGRPVFGDYDGDGRPDLFVPGPRESRLFHNDGAGRFSDVTAKSGLGSLVQGGAACALWADFDPPKGDGRLDLFVGCLRAPNRFFRNNGTGTFAEASTLLGFHQRIFNTGALAVFDVNGDRVPDLVMNNEGQEGVVLLGSADRPDWTAAGARPRRAGLP